MIEIIKTGKIKKYELTCNECGCSFTFNIADTKIHIMSDYSIRVIDCPYCGIVCRYNSN